MSDGAGRMVPEDPAFRAKVQETLVRSDGSLRHRWVPCRPLPQDDPWFETAWAEFACGDIFRRR